MWKAKLNQHFAKIAFLVWNLVFHSLWLSALFFFSSGNNFSSLWIENQVLFAALSISLFAFVFREEWRSKFRNPVQARSFLVHGFVQASVVAILVAIQGVLSHQLDFLGFSSQLGVNFLSSYSWVLRSLLLFMLAFSLNGITKNLAPYWMGLPLQCFFFWLWFQPTLLDYCWITLIYSIHSSFLFSTGLMSGFFIMTHAVFGSSLMGNEFSGLLQFKWLQEEGSLLRSPALILGLFFIFFVNKIKVMIKRRKDTLLHEPR